MLARYTAALHATPVRYALEQLHKQGLAENPLVSKEFTQLVRALLGRGESQEHNDAAAHILGKLPHGFDYLGHGHAAVVLGRPGGTHVARMTTLPNFQDPFFGRRPKLTGLLPALSSHRTGPFGMEFLEQRHPLDKFPAGVLTDNHRKAMQAHLQALLGQQGWYHEDLSEQNIGLHRAGVPQILDSGGLRPGENPHDDHPYGEGTHAAFRDAVARGGVFLGGSQSSGR